MLHLCIAKRGSGKVPIPERQSVGEKTREVAPFRRHLLQAPEADQLANPVLTDVLVIGVVGEIGIQPRQRRFILLDGDVEIGR